MIGAGVVIRPEGHRVSDVDMRSCYAWVTTGTPPTHALYNETICSANSPLSAPWQAAHPAERSFSPPLATRAVRHSTCV